MNFKSIVITFVIAIMVSCSIFFGMEKFKGPQFGFVKTGIILAEYKGMILANEQFNKELSIVKGNIDTLRNRFEALKAQEHKVPTGEKSQWGYRLGTAQKEYEQYNKTASQQMQQRQEQLTRTVLDKINSFISEYGKKNGYDFIYGATTEGSILYGKESKDLTSELLKSLNNEYVSSKGNATESKAK